MSEAVLRAAHAAVISRLLRRLGPQAVQAVLDEVIDAGGLRLGPAGYLRVQRGLTWMMLQHPARKLALLLEQRLHERGRLDAEAAQLAALDAAAVAGGPASVPTRGVAVHVQPADWPANAPAIYQRYPQFCTSCGRTLSFEEFRSVQGVVLCSNCRRG